MGRRRSIFGTLTNQAPEPTPSFISPETLKRESAIAALAAARADGEIDGVQVAISPPAEAVASTVAMLTWSAGLSRAMKTASPATTSESNTRPSPAPISVAYVDPVLCSDGILRYAAQLRPLAVHVLLPRRYSEWLALHEALQAQNVNVSIHFPGKHVWWSPCREGPGGRHDPTVVRQRASVFHAWADELIELPGALELPVVREFFALV